MPRTFLALLLASVAAPSFAAAIPAVPVVDSATPADRAFAALARDFLETRVKNSPVGATQLGDHRYDAEVDDLSAAGFAARATSAKRLLAALGRIDRTKLSRDNQVDAALLDNELKRMIWTVEELQDWRFDPQIYNGVAGGALYNLAARDFAPWNVRLRAATARMEKIPAVLAAARANLDPAKVPPIMATTLARQNPGVGDLVDSFLRPHLATLSAAERTRFEAAATGLKAAVAEHQRWIEGTLVPNAKGDFRLGAARYDRKLAFALNTPLTRAEIKARAEAALRETRAEMYAVSRTLLAGKPGAPATPERPTPDQEQAAIEAALELSYAERPPRDGMIATANETLKAVTAFATKADFVTMPTSPVRIIEVPKHLQGVAVAYCYAPGPLERTAETFYAVSPIPAAWTDEQATSFLREYNDFMLEELSIHEAVPGHYLQIAHSSKHPSLLRAVLGSDPFVEGWAVYSERLMDEAGYMADDQRFRLTMLKMRLRAITNALLDIGVHAEGMSEADAMRLMTHTAFQQEREAAGKWTRAQLLTAQLPTYFVGYTEHVALREEARRRDGTRFDLKRYNDAVLSHGSPPVRFARALMFGEAIAP